MKVSANTKISEVIKLNPNAIDVIASINSHFGKLKNPFLRKLLAPRVTVEQAASIGKVSVKEFLTKLQGINMEIEFPDEEAIDQERGESFKEEADLTLDVRPLIAEGKDPLKQILETVKKLNPGETLLLINTFEPFPLIQLLSKKGITSRVVKESDDLVYTYFIKQESKSIDLDTRPEGDFETVRNKYNNLLKEVDVRELEMPGPMIKILEELEELPEEFALFVHHKKVPQFLLPELYAKGYSVVYNQEGADGVKLIIYK